MTAYARTSEKAAIESLEDLGFKIVDKLIAWNIPALTQAERRTVRYLLREHGYRIDVEKVDQVRD